MTKAILVNFHLYTPFGKSFYEPILDFFLMTMKKYEDEYDHLYLLDSNWNIEPEKIKDMKASIIRTNPHIRYYDAYKEVLPQIKEDLVLFMDNDMIVYRKGNIEDTFAFLKEGINIVSIYASIGTWRTDKMNGKNKFCPFWFATKKDLLMKYRNIEWGPEMSEFETLGRLTKVMIENGIKAYEWPEDYSKLYFDGTTEPRELKRSKDLGYYHIQAGSTPAYLLAAKNSLEHKKTYEEYLKNQPKQELLRHCAWYQYMGGDPKDIYRDMGIAKEFWNDYMDKFKEFHGL